MLENVRFRIPIPKHQTDLPRSIEVARAVLSKVGAGRDPARRTARAGETVPNDLRLHCVTFGNQSPNVLPSFSQLIITAEDSERRD
ncbi:hypothetical protein AVEN_76463-1 [Araneus ventricosus]|uniref:Uncharacterized protein n=1 Tax=Araneus ventricosus TaxID=182803 RepID=A0A4Y2LAP5_ARAVE|nr:hypothetical protein AVEN_76463-1 [Araneus ventricosus]